MTNLKPAAEEGFEAADQLDEMAAQATGLVASEPVGRVSSIRDLTNGIAGMEYAVGQTIRTAPSEEEAEDEKDIATS